MLTACDGGGATAVTTASAAPSVAPVVTASVTASAVAAAPMEVAAQHVLIAYKGAKNAKGVKRSKEEAKKLAAEVHEKAVKGEDFSELAKKYSDDPASRERLGSVGKFKRDEMVKPFADAAFALEVGGISAPVESELGFHVIKRNQ